MAETTMNRIDGILSIVGSDGAVQGLACHAWEGGEVVEEEIRDRSPGERFDHPIRGLPTISPITLTLTYDHAKHGGALAWLKRNTGAVGFASKILRDANMAQTGTEDYGVMVGEVRPPAGDSRDNSGKGEWSIVLFAVNF